MDALLPLLDVRGPEGEHFTVELAQDRVTIGRLPEFNAVALQPDPQQLITRQVHCFLERRDGTWWVVDEGSINGTFVQRGEALEVVEGRALLGDGDVIWVLGRLVDPDEPVYWNLAFKDPLKTQRVAAGRRPVCVEYDRAQARLIRVEGAKRSEIRELRPQERRLVAYMAQRNRSNRNVPVLCTYDDLMAAVWGDEAEYHSQDELHRLVWDLRRKIEPDPKLPQLLQTRRGLGYILSTCLRS